MHCDEPSQLRRDAQPDRESTQEFIACALHDLKASLRTIRMGADLITPVESGQMQETQMRCKGFIEDGLEKAGTLVHDIAAYCYQCIDEFVPESTDLDLVVREALRVTDMDLRDCGAQVECDSLPKVLGMFDPLKTAFSSLLRNSCKFRGRNPLTIKIAATRLGSEWIIALSDNGIGFEPAYAERIFRPFEKLHGPKHPGSGLGLALARVILEQHGGRIWAESQPNQGATFKLSLPAVRGGC